MTGIEVRSMDSEVKAMAANAVAAGTSTGTADW